MRAHPVGERETELLDELDKVVKRGEPARDFGNLENSTVKSGSKRCQHAEPRALRTSLDATHPSLSTRRASRSIRIQSVPIKLRQHTTASTTSPPATPPGSGTDEHSASTT